MSDFTDVALAADGDHQAFERLFRRYVIRVYSVCTRLSGSRKQGEELTREVFVRTWQQLPELRGETAHGPWLHRLAIDVALNARKLEGEAATRIERQGSPAERSNDVGAAPDDAERPDLSQAIDALPEDPRRIFVLHDVERYKHEEIAEIFGITVGKSKAQLRRARSLLIETLAG
ncbi:MAG: sigma-70 family RNA polymerase sigma factor [Gemmatimonadota bacterium]|nr:sigma-70 family RNA polymerase sigma factor [Gemmatimonadota bacterium]